MALVLPSVLGYAAMLPLVRRDLFSTHISAFANLTEQRYPEQAQLNEYQLTYTSISRSSADTLSAFFALMQAQQQPFVFTQPITTVSTFDTVDCYFSGTSFSWRETFEGQYSGSIRFRASHQQAQAAPTQRASFPALFQSLYQQFPIERGTMGVAYASRMKNGPVYSAPIQLGQRPKRNWKWPLVLTKTQLGILQNFFILQQGQYGRFQFVDPGTPAETVNCRFGTDTLESQYVGVNNIRTGVYLIEDL